MSSGIIGGNISSMGVFQLSVDLSNNPTITTAVTSVTVPGVRVGDFVFANKPTATTGVGIVNVRVSAANTVEIQTMNPTIGAIDPAAEIFVFVWIRPEAVETGIRP